MVRQAGRAAQIRALTLAATDLREMAARGIFRTEVQRRFSFAEGVADDLELSRHQARPDDGPWDERGTLLPLRRQELRYVFDLRLLGLIERRSDGAIGVRGAAEAREPVARRSLAYEIVSLFHLQHHKDAVNYRCWVIGHVGNPRRHAVAPSKNGAQS